jgi:hypothetical protein
MEIKLYEPKDVIPQQQIQVVVEHPTKPGVMILNPNLEAKIVERVFLDGDIPELRTGPLHTEGIPAVPVLTDSLNSLVVGEMLEQASNFVKSELDNKLLGFVESNEPTDLVKHPEVYNLLGIYSAGTEVPLMEVQPKSLGELVSCTVEKQREWVYKTISTTQGRRSLQYPIEHRMWETLLGLGYVRKVCLNPQEFYTHWEMTTWGSEDMQVGFNPASVACNALLKDFTNKVGPTAVQNIQVESVNMYAERVFGWSVIITYCGGE